MSIKKIILNLAIYFFPLLMMAQSPFSKIENASDNSPYSRFGIGEISEGYFSHLYHMGGLGAAYQDPYHLNIVNPASLASLKSTSFEVGLYGEYSRLTEGTNNYSSWNGNLSYLALGFPLANPINDLLDRVERNYDLGMSFSLTPYSTVGYDVQTIEDNETVGPIIKRFVGNGGTYNFQWGNAIKYKDVSFGVNLGYLFGSIASDRVAILQNYQYAFHNVEKINYHPTGFTWNAGFQYEKVINEKQIKEDNSLAKKRITLGLYGNSPTGFNINSDELFLTVRTTDISNPNQITINDTIVNAVNVKYKGKLAGKLGIGAMYTNGNKLGVGFNYEWQNWSRYFNEANPISLSDSYKISAGGFFSPDPTSISNYFKRIKYQIGVFYKKDPVSVLNEEISTAGFQFGLELPFINQRRVSNTNIGVTFANKGIGTAIEERYTRINFGFTFNSTEWFIKRKYN